MSIDEETQFHFSDLSPKRKIKKEEHKKWQKIAYCLLFRSIVGGQEQLSFPHNHKPKICHYFQPIKITSAD